MADLITIIFGGILNALILTRIAKFILKKRYDLHKTAYYTFFSCPLSM
ncbi:hypothetical protein [Alkalibacillus haloalkaliphilus]|nr:hypothetical protein [Alkalibacillus haloalkaliphilus]